MEKTVPPVLVKMCTYWMRDNKYPVGDIDKYNISHGVWETCGVEWDNNHRVIQLKLVWPGHKNLTIGETRKMYEDVLIAICHQVEINHLPKINK